MLVHQTAIHAEAVRGHKEAQIGSSTLGALGIRNNHRAAADWLAVHAVDTKDATLIGKSWFYLSPCFLYQS